MTLTFTEKNPQEYKKGDVLVLRWIPESRIPGHHAQYVQRHVDQLAKENDLGTVRVRWFRPTEPRLLRVTRRNGVVVDVMAFDALDRPDPQPVDGEPGEFWMECDADGTAIAFVTRSLPNTISLYATLRGNELPRVIAHEIRHLVQNRDSLAVDPEADADIYGVEYLRRAG